MKRTFLIIAYLFCLSLQAELTYVLTNNPGKDEAGLKTGCTYTAAPAFHSPADKNGRRLVDGDVPRNWRTTTGINKPKQTVVFDLKRIYQISKTGLLFDRKEKPASVTISISDNPNGPWQKLTTLSVKEQKNPWWEADFSNKTGRYVKLDHIRNRGKWNLREVKIYGRDIFTKGKSLTGTMVNGKLRIIDSGKANACIVVADHASSRTLEAAAVFQQLAQRITGVNMGIIQESEYDGSSTAVFIGDGVNVRQHGINVNQLPSDGDHYIIQRGINYLVLAGNDAAEFSRKNLRGSIYAVYDFFTRLGCGWFGPDPLWQVIPKSKTLDVPSFDIDERPDFLYRLVWMHRMKSQELRDAWREGGLERRGGHAYYKMVPPKIYKKIHPEWFGKGQPDITNPDVIALVVKSLRKVLDAEPDNIVVPFSFSSNDNGGFVVNDRTKKIGNISAQQLYFANEVAKELNKTHKGRFRLDCLAYWKSHTSPVPMMKAEPGVQVMIVNEGNHTKPLDMPESAEAKAKSRSNTRVVKAIAGWKKTGGLNGIYEWYIPAISNIEWQNLPWIAGQVTLRNLRYWKKNGIKYVYYEAQKEKNGGFPSRWLTYYQCYRGMWNCKLTAKEITEEACKKLFGPVAGPYMTNYYNTLEQAMLNCKDLVGNWHFPYPPEVYTPDVEKQAEHWIKLAENAAKSSNDPKIKQRVAVEMDFWKNTRTILQRLRDEVNAINEVTLDGKIKQFKGTYVSRTLLRKLFKLNKKTNFIIVEADGQTRLLKKAVRLTPGLKFKIAK